MKKLEELEISPAPWKVSPHDDTLVTTHDGFRVAIGCCERYDGGRGNAHLIAAAPKLYDAAERLLRFHDESCIHGNRTFEEITKDYKKAMTDLKTALAEARGDKQ